LKTNPNIEEQFDQWCKNTFDHAEVSPPADVWNQVSQQCAPTTQTTVDTTSFWSSFTTSAKVAIAAAAVTIAATAPWWGSFLQQDQPTPPPLEENVDPLPEPIISTEAEDNMPYDGNTHTAEAGHIRQEQSTPSTPEATNSPQTVFNITSHTRRTSDPASIDVTHSSSQPIPPPEMSSTPTNTTTGAPHQPSVPGEAATYIVLKDTFMCEKGYDFSQRFFGDKQIKCTRIETGSETFLPPHFFRLKNKTCSTITTYGEHPSGMTYKRTVYFKTHQTRLVMEHAGEGAFKATLQGGDEGGSIQWHINGEKMYDELSEIVYYRNIEFQTHQTIMLKVRYTDEHQCTDIVEKDATPYLYANQSIIPNIFTPNNDGLNDVWKVVLPGASEFHLSVLGADNVTLFKTSVQGHFWNGTNMMGEKVSDGQYLYMLRYVDEKGKTISKTGVVTINSH
jgi:gliding motility-associated-like protein